MAKSNRKALKRPDEFVSTGQKVGASLQENTKLFVGIIIGGLIAIAGFAWWSNLSDRRLTEARNRLFEARVLLQEDRATLTKADEPESMKKPENKDDFPAAMNEQDSAKLYEKVDVDQTYDKSLPKLKSVAKDYQGLRPGFEARFELGNIFLNHGKSDLAQDWYDQAVDSAPGKYEETLALVAAAASYENTSQFDKALERVEKAIKLGVKPLRGEVLLAKARTLEALGKKDEAKKTYDQLISEIPGTTHAKKAEVYRAQIH